MAHQYSQTCQLLYDDLAFQSSNKGVNDLLLIRLMKYLSIDPEKSKPPAKIEIIMAPLLSSPNVNAT